MCPYPRIIKYAFPSTILWVYTYMQIPKNCAYTYTCNSLWHNNIHKMPTFALQKPYFCVIKTPFLHAKNHTFARQKPYFCNAKTTFLVDAYIALIKHETFGYKTFLPKLQNTAHNMATHTTHYGIYTTTVWHNFIVPSHCTQPQNA